MKGLLVLEEWWVVENEYLKGNASCVVFAFSLDFQHQLLLFLWRLEAGGREGEDNSEKKNQEADARSEELMRY